MFIWFVYVSNDDMCKEEYGVNGGDTKHLYISYLIFNNFTKCPQYLQYV